MVIGRWSFASRTKSPRLTQTVDNTAANCPYALSRRREHSERLWRSLMASRDPCGVRGSNSPPGCYSLPLTALKSTGLSFTTAASRSLFYGVTDCHGLQSKPRNDALHYTFCSYPQDRLRRFEDAFLRRTVYRPRVKKLSLRNFRPEMPKHFRKFRILFRRVFIKNGAEIPSFFYGSRIRYIAPPEVMTAVLSVVMPITSFTCMGSR